MTVRQFAGVALVLTAQLGHAQRSSSAPAAIDVHESPGTLFILQASRYEGTTASQTYPHIERVCASFGGFIVRSGWLVLRGSWWVAVDSVMLCDNTPFPNFRIEARVDSGVTGALPDGSGLVLMRGRDSPLPGPAAILHWTTVPSDSLRMSDTVTMIGADSSETFIYIRCRHR